MSNVTSFNAVIAGYRVFKDKGIDVKLGWLVDAKNNDPTRNNNFAEMVNTANKEGNFSVIDQMNNCIHLANGIFTAEDIYEPGLKNVCRENIKIIKDQLLENYKNSRVLNKIKLLMPSIFGQPSLTHPTLSSLENDLANIESADVEGREIVARNERLLRLIESCDKMISDINSVPSRSNIFDSLVKLKKEKLELIKNNGDQCLIDKLTCYETSLKRMLADDLLTLGVKV